jgi:ankyrin repeat protein
MQEDFSPENLMFQYIRNHKYDDLINLINSNKFIDINKYDIHGNFLLTYAVRFNSPDIVKFLLDKGSRFDIVNKSGKSIIYEAIDNNFIEIITTLIDHSFNNIGISIVDIKDKKGAIAIHYAIKHENLYIVEQLIKYNSNLYHKDINGYNSLHLSAKNKNEKIAGIIIKYMNNLDYRNNNGETAIHIAIKYKNYSTAMLIIENNANPNISDRYDRTPLHYAVSNNSHELCKKILSKGGNPSAQDIHGDTPLNYSIAENNLGIFEDIIKYKPQINIWNIFGRTTLHNVFYYRPNDISKYTDLLIDDSDLTMKDSLGNTCLHFLIETGLWKKYSDIIKKKKINILTKNSDGKRPIDILKIVSKELSDIDFLIEITIESYLHILKGRSDWTNKLDIICSKEIVNLTDEEKKYISGIKNANSTNFCRKFLKSKIKECIDSPEVDTTILNPNADNPVNCNRSYPVKYNCPFKFQKGIIVDICTFTGSSLDVVMGLIYLLKKHPNSCSVINISYKSKEKIKIYKKMGNIINSQLSHLEFEIIWSETKLFVMDNFDEKIFSCKKRFVIIPLGIKADDFFHSNYLIYDKEKNEIERFEPHGGQKPIGMNYNSKFLDSILEKYFLQIDKKIKYIGPEKYIPKVGFQLMDIQETEQNRIGDPIGFCALWSIWYTDQRLSYPDIDRNTLVDSLFDHIRLNDLSFKNIVRNHSRQIIDMRDKLLENAGLDINNYENQNYTNEQLDKLFLFTTDKIKKYA